MDFHTKTIEKCFEQLESSPQGLSAIQAMDRTKEYGSNLLVVKGEPLWRKIVEPFANVFMAVLFVAVGVSVWHHDYIDAAIIGAIMLANAIIYYIQQFSTERVLRALQKTNPHIVTVVHDGKQLQVDATELVPGDYILLDEGQKIPADCRLVDVSSLRVDESQLTGESLPIEKTIEPLRVRQLADDKNAFVKLRPVWAGAVYADPFTSAPGDV
jgi:Ca2+-transporting ATPase